MKSSLSRSISAVIVLLTGILCSVAPAQDRSRPQDCKPIVEIFLGTREKLFGTKLSPNSMRLLAEVESLFGRSVSEWLCADQGGATAAYSFFDYEGGPFIFAIEGRGTDEDSIVHELHHLRLIAKGYPILTACPTPDQTDPEQLEYVRFVRQELDNALQHSVFYPEMRRRGLAPQSANKLNSLTASNDWNDIRGAFAEKKRALRFFALSLEFEGQKESINLRKWYTTKGWLGELRLADEMLNIVRQLHPITPKSEVAIVRSCLVKLSTAYYRLQLGNINTQPRGRYQVSFANIYGMPVMRNA